MPEISKITLPSGSTYDIKDATARAAIANIHTFDYQVCTNAANTPKDVQWKSGGTTITGTLVASSSTMYKIYLVPQDNATGDYYDEYITVNPSGSTYNWEKFGSTQIDIDNLKAFAYADTGTATFTPGGSNASSAVSFTGGTTDTFAKTVEVTTQPSVTLTESSSTSTGALTYVKSIGTSGTNAVTFATSGNTADAITGLPSSTVPKTVGTTKYLKTSATAGSTTTIKNPTIKTVVTDMSVSDPSSTTATGELVYCSVTDETLSLKKFVETTGDSITTSNVTVKTGDPTISLSSADSTSTGAVAYTASVTESGTNDVTFGTPTTTTVLKSTVTATVPKTSATTRYMTASASGTAVGVATSGNAVTNIGTGTAAAQTFTGTQQTITVNPVTT